MNDYNDRSIRTACVWYKNHVPNKKFVLMTDDAANRKLAKELNIAACSGILKISPHIVNF